MRESRDATLRRWTNRIGIAIAIVLGIGMLAALGTCVLFVASLDLRREPDEIAGRDPEPAPYETPDCHPVDHSERERSIYSTFGGQGSARALAGQVAIVVLQVGGGRESWVDGPRTQTVHAASATCDFFGRQAMRRGVAPPSCRVLPVGLDSASVPLPTLHLEARRTVTPESIAELGTILDDAVRQVLGERLAQSSARMHDAGYDQVAFLAFFPIETDARDFAQPRWGEEPEIAIQFIGSEPQGVLDWTASHEILHLFGADDLYRVTPFDPRDTNDVMGHYCVRLGDQAAIHDTTAHAIGWRPEPPPRDYGIRRWGE